MDNTQFLSIKEAADYLQVDYKVVYRLVKEGRLPASRVGWQFRITPGDIEAYLRSQRIGDNHTGASAGDADSALRPPAVPHDTNVIPPRVDAQIPLGREDAKKLEAYVCDAFAGQVGEIDSLQHPEGGALIHVQDWAALCTIRDERTRLLDILETAFLDRKTLAVTPLNTHVRYLVKDSPLLSIELKFLGHLNPFATEHVDSAPATRAELLRFLDGSALTAQAMRIVGCVSPTGWDELAVEQARDQAWLAANNLLLYLIDVRTGSVVYNEQSAMTRRYAGLFGFADAFRHADEG
ncbi:MAG: helix-turn-helix domain-containing protein [Caldilineaceae bacterium]|nr:helix-turn-helix domain-containing protein [Caldilineaceae bacterium]